MKIILRLCVLAVLGTCLASSANLFAVPANRAPITIIQPDGSQLTVIKYGDEYFHYQTTLDGYSVSQGEDGFYYYLEEKAGTIGRSSVRANNQGQRNSAENAMLGTLRKELVNRASLTSAAMRRSGAAIARAERVERRVASEDSAPMLRAPATKADPTSAKVLVILVNYSDLTFRTANNQSAFNNLLNQTGYSTGGATGSARDYFYDSSCGTFQPQFDVVGPVTLPYGYAYYGANDVNGDDVRPGEMIRDACMAAKTQVAGLNFADYATNGEVEHLFVIFAGKGEADGGADDTIWPHEWALRWALGSAITLDGVKINTYACSPELKGSGALTGVGVICHEFGHVLGIPDFYDTDGDDNGRAETPDVFSLMDYGPYLNDGMTPPAMSSYERYVAGWLTYEDITSEGTYTLEARSLYDNNKAYRIKTFNTSGQGEVFVFENRNGLLNKWDNFMTGAYAQNYVYFGSGSGMLIFHVDHTNPVKWLSTNTVNAIAARPGYKLIKATNSASWQRIGDYFFPATGKNSFLTTSTPDAFLDWSGNGTGLEIINIKKQNNDIVLTVAGSNTSIEELRTDIGQFDVTLSWDWDLDGDWIVRYKETGKIADNETTSQTTYNLRNLKPGTEYEIRVYYKNNTSNGKTINITTLPLEEGKMPVIDMDATYPTGEHVTLRVKNLKNDISSVVWRVNGTIEALSSKVFTQPGEYTIEAEVTNADRSVEYLRRIITIE